MPASTYPGAGLIRQGQGRIRPCLTGDGLGGRTGRFDAPPQDFAASSGTRTEAISCGKSSILYASRADGHARPSIALDIYAHEFEEARGTDDIAARLTAAFGV